MRSNAFCHGGGYSIQRTVSHAMIVLRTRRRPCWQWRAEWEQQPDPVPGRFLEVARFERPLHSQHKRQHADIVCGVEFSPDGNLLACAGVAKQARLCCHLLDSCSPSLHLLSLSHLLLCHFASCAHAHACMNFMHAWSKTEVLSREAKAVNYIVQGVTKSCAVGRSGCTRWRACARARRRAAGACAPPSSTACPPR